MSVLTIRVDSRIQKNRSAPPNCGFRRARCLTMTWCESARCSHTKSKRERSTDVKVARTLLTDQIIVGQHSVGNLLETQQIPCGSNFW
jgi:hypothetical protein